MKMRKITTTALSGILAAICAFASMSIPSAPVMADTGDVKINSTNFSDSYFRTYVKSFDTNNDDILSMTERNAVTEINIKGNTQIQNLSGIKNFPNLKKLDASSSTKITYVNLKDNINIEYINFSSTPLSSINILNCNKITYLNLSGTKVSKVDLRCCDNLTYLDVSGTSINKISIINTNSILNTYKTVAAKKSTSNGVNIISHGNKLSDLYFSYNSGTTIVSVCPEGYIDYNTSIIRASGFYDRLLDADDDQDGLISPSENANFTFLYIDGTEISSLSFLSNFPNIETLDISSCKLSSFDGSLFPNLKNLRMDMIDGLTSVDVSTNKDLEQIWVFDCSSLSSLNVANNPSLVELGLCGSLIDTIDISNNPDIIELYKNDAAHHSDVTSDGLKYEYWNETKNGKYGYFGINTGTKVITEKQVSDTPVNPSIPVTPGTPTTPVTPVPVTPATPAPETGLAGFIERLYNVALGRQSEAQGKNWWINKVKFENYTGSDVANGFLVSDEFLGKQMTNDQFLEVLYKTFFDRASDAQGKAYWLNLMANGYSKSDVINGFCNSTEWANLCLTYGIPSGSSAAPTIVITPNEGTNAFVTRLYTTCLGRQPEAAGFEYWTYRLANMQERGSSAAYGFFTSPEFTGKGYDNATYVTLLYRTILGREPDQAGLNYWLGLMNGGMSRENVLNGFAASTEWADICSSYGILK